MKRNIYTFFVTMAAGLVMFEAATAQVNYIDQITIENQAVSKKAGITTIAFDVNLNGLQLDKNDMLLVTPVISSTENGSRTELEPFAVKGRLRYKILNRPFDRKGKAGLNIPGDRQIVRKNRSAQSLHYTTTLPFNEWQRQARLILQAEIIGCADCHEEQPEKTVSNKILPDPLIPDYRIPYIVPEVEQVKQRSEKYSAHLNYMVGHWDLLPNFENNAVELAKVDEIISKLKKNTDLAITDFTISGYASPEGAEGQNLLLSQRRAETFAGYIEKNHGYQRDQFTIKWLGEDWGGLREAVAASQLANKEAILYIIDNEPSLDARDARLIALDNGVTYNRLLHEFYPPLRRNEYNISFISRPFNVEEASRVIKTHPGLLSLNEMFLVAGTYREDSPQYKEVFDIAANTFPNDDTANINAAVGELRYNNADAALERLRKVENNPAAWNLMGIAYSIKGDTEQAKEYLGRAANNGNTDAAHNLDQLQQYINENL